MSQMARVGQGCRDAILFDNKMLLHMLRSIRLVYILHLCIAQKMKNVITSKTVFKTIFQTFWTADGNFLSDSLQSFSRSSANYKYNTYQNLARFNANKRRNLIIESMRCYYGIDQ